MSLENRAKIKIKITYKYFDMLKFIFIGFLKLIKSSVSKASKSIHCSGFKTE